LAFTASQRDEITGIYHARKEMSLVFSADFHDQVDAQQFLEFHGLDRASRAQLENRWNVQWSNAWTVGKEGDHRRRILLQWYDAVCS
jgi:hypothetical protein